jgi:hypothetical protein
MNKSHHHKTILSLCLTISVITHALFLLFIQTHSLWFCSSVERTKSTSTRALEIVSKSQILKEAFAPTPSTPTPSFNPQPEPTSSTLVQVPRKKLPEPPALVAEVPNFPLFPLPDLSLESLLSSESFSKAIHLTPKVLNRTANFLEGLILPPLDSLPAVSFQPLPMPPLKPQHLATAILKPKQNQPVQDPDLHSLPLIAENHSFVPEEGEPSSPRTAPSIPLPNLPQFFSLAELDTVNLSDAFNAELTFLSKPNDSGYLFALTLVPRGDLNLPKIQQRITFLIDRANSIQRERLIASKQAVLRALEELDVEDSFNIIVFDSKTEKLFATFSAVTPAAISKAEEFLDKINLGSFFATSDPYKPLLLTIPGHVQEDEIHTAILLTDGETLSSKAIRQALTHDWTLQNQGKVSLYVVGMETDPNSQTLEILCTLNRGRFIQSSSQRGLKRQILKLAKNIKTPLAKDLSSKIICRSSDHKIEIHPGPALAPHMYLNQPYVIVGSTDTLDDFLVFVQGRLKNQWLNVKKTISFVNAKKGNSSLKTAFHQYEKLDLSSKQEVY